MYIRVVILLRTFNPPNVAELKIDHVSLVVWYKHFDRRSMWALFLRTVQLYRQFLDINSLLYRPKIARELTIPRSFIHYYANPATTYIDRTSIIPRSFILCRVKRATSKTTKELTRMFIIPRSFIQCRAKQAGYTRFPLLRTTSGADFVSVITRIGNSGALEIISYLVYKHMK